MSYYKLLYLLPLLIISLGLIGCKALTETLVIIAESGSVTNTPVPPTSVKIPNTAAPAVATKTSIPPTDTTEPSTPTSEPLTPTPDGLRQVIITYVENGSPVAGKEIWLAYFDEESANWVVNNQTTGQDGIVTFGVPGIPSGASCTFTFSTSEETIQQSIDAIKARQKTGIRIPDANQTTLELQLDNTGNMTIKGGSIQFWIP